MNTVLASHPPWWAALPRLPALPLPPRADVLVLGAGLPGLAAATALAAGGARVVLLERHDRAGAGVSGRAPGVHLPGLVEPLDRTARSLGDGPTATLLALHARGLAALPPATAPAWSWGFTPRDDQALDGVAATLRRLGMDAAIHADARLPAAGWPEDAPAAPRALRSEGGAAVSPVAAVAHAVSAAVAAGVQLGGAAEVRALTDTSDGVVAHTPRGTVRAEMVLNTAEAGAGAIDPSWAALLLPVREAARAAPATGPSLPASLRAGLGYITLDAHEGDVIAAGARFATPHLEVGEHDPTVVADAVSERLAAVLQRVTTAPPGPPWAWITTVTPDGLPLVGPQPGSPRRLVAAGFLGLDATLGVGCALAVADALLGHDDPAHALLRPHRLL